MSWQIEANWRMSSGNGLSRCCHPRNQKPDDQYRIIERSPMGYFGFCAPAHPGEICPNDAVMDESLQTLSGLAEKGSMAESSIRIANASRSTGRTEWGTWFRGRDDHSCPATCCRGKKHTPLNAVKKWLKRGWQPFLFYNLMVDYLINLSHKINF